MTQLNREDGFRIRDGRRALCFAHRKLHPHKPFGSNTLHKLEQHYARLWALSVVFMVVSFGALLIVRAGPWNAAGGVLLVALGGAGGAMLVRTIYGVDAKVQRKAEEMARQHSCPVCLYTLGGLPAADDGCTVCPECGAAWRLDGATADPEGSRG